VYIVRLKAVPKRHCIILIHKNTFVHTLVCHFWARFKWDAAFRL